MQKLAFTSLVILVCAPARGALVANFDDLPVGGRWNPGSSFVSGDIGFTVTSPTYGVSVTTSRYAGGSVNEAWLGSGVEVDVWLPAGVTQISFAYGDYNSSRIVVNGVSSPNTSGHHIHNANGMTLGGVGVTIASGPPTTRGIVATLTGPVQSLRLWGVEFAIDNLIVTAPTPKADFNGDGFVGGTDFLAWQRGLGRSTGATAFHGDSDGDHDVDLADLRTLRVQFGRPAPQAPPAVMVPEPTALGLAVASAGLLGQRRRRSISRSEPAVALRAG